MLPTTLVFANARRSRGSIMRMPNPKNPSSNYLQQATGERNVQNPLEKIALITGTNKGVGLKSTHICSLEKFEGP